MIDSTTDSEETENLVFFYHTNHLGSTSYVTDSNYKFWHPGITMLFRYSTRWNYKILFC